MQSSRDMQSALGILQHLSVAELEQLNDNDDRQMAIIQNNEEVKNIDVQRDTMLARNKSFAEYNLQKEPKLTQAKRQLAAVYDRIVKLQKTAEQNKQQLDACGSENSLDTVLAVLQTETAKADELSERTAAEFVEGKIEVDDFIDQYSVQRKIVHLRRVKIEKMMEITRSMELGAAAAPYPTTSALYPMPPAVNFAAPPEPIKNLWLGHT